MMKMALVLGFVLSFAAWGSLLFGLVTLPGDRKVAGIFIGAALVMFAVVAFFLPAPFVGN